MQQIHARFVGVELYFDNVERAKKFYLETLGLRISDEQVGHHARFDSGASFVCLERKGAESYPSRDKAVLFFEVPDLESAIRAIGEEQLVQSEPRWAALHDPEGHNVVLLESSVVEEKKQLAGDNLAFAQRLPILPWPGPTFATYVPLPSGFGQQPC